MRASCARVDLTCVCACARVCLCVCVLGQFLVHGCACAFVCLGVCVCMRPCAFTCGTVCVSTFRLCAGVRALCSFVRVRGQCAHACVRVGCCRGAGYVAARMTRRGCLEGCEDGCYQGFACASAAVVMVMVVVLVSYVDLCRWMDERGGVGRGSGRKQSGQERLAGLGWREKVADGGGGSRRERANRREWAAFG